MYIYIMRHGEAQTFASTDEERPLTAKGEHTSIKMAQWLVNHHVTSPLDKILVSPYLRAQQTWKACEDIIPHQHVTTEDALTPFGDWEQVAVYLRALIGLENISSLLLVSHLPLVGYLTAEFSPGLSAPMFPTSGMACIELDPKTEKSHFLWLKTP